MGQSLDLGFEIKSYSLRIHVVESMLWSCADDPHDPCTVRPTTRALVLAGFLFVAVGFAFVLGALAIRAGAGTSCKIF